MVRKGTKVQGHQHLWPPTVKWHINKQENDSGQNFQKDKKIHQVCQNSDILAPCGDGAHADLSTEVWML